MSKKSNHQSKKLHRVLRLDSIAMDNTYFTDEGYLVDCPVVTTTGIFEYKGQNGKIKRELRLPEHVFDPDSLASYLGKPIIITHEGGAIDKDNVSKESIGTILSEGYQDGDTVRCKIVIHDTNLMERSGLKELSLGYDQDDINESGEYEGEPYDIIQSNIRINHLALVFKARAGPEAHLNIDGKETPTIETLRGVKTMKKKTKPQTRNSRKKRNDGDMLSAVEQFQQRRDQRMADRNNDNELDPPPTVPPQQVDNEGAETKDGCQCVKDNRDMRDDSGDPSSLEEAMVQIANMDEDLDALLGMLEAVTTDSAIENEDEEDEDDEDDEEGSTNDSSQDESKSMNADSVDAIIRERMKLGRLGARIHIDGLEELPPMDAKKKIIKKVKPSLRLDGQNRTYINAAFDVVAQEIESKTKDTNFQRSQMFHTDSAERGRVHTQQSGASKSRENMLNKMYKGGN